MINKKHDLNRAGENLPTKTVLNKVKKLLKAKD